MPRPHELSHDELESILSSIEIPACPTVVTRVMMEAQKDEPDINAIARTIAADVGMSAFAIKLANSPLFRRGGAVDNVPHAVARLGTRNVACVVVAVALRDSMKSDIPAERLERFWNRASTLALAASLTARRVRGVAADMAYTYGLFHDAAIPVMMRRFPDYAEAWAALEKAPIQSLAEMEDARYHCTHAVVGGLLARNWGLPAVIASAIRHHHDASVYPPDSEFRDGTALGLMAVTQVGERLVEELRGEPDLEVRELFGRATAYLGLSEDDLHDLRDDIGAIL